MKQTLYMTVALSLMSLSSAYGQTPAACKQATPTVPDKITYDSKVYSLQWKVNGRCGFHKYEYFAEDMNGQFTSYKEMLMLDVYQAVAGQPVENATTATRTLVQNLTARKKSDPVANFQVLKNDKTQEIAVDFVMSDKMSTDKGIIEWNFYRHKDYTGNNAQKYMVKLGISRRIYEKDDSDGMGMHRLMGDKNAKRAKLIELDIPKVF